MTPTALSIADAIDPRSAAFDVTRRPEKIVVYTADLIAASDMLRSLFQQAAVSRRLAIEEAAKVMDGYADLNAAHAILYVHGTPTRRDHEDRERAQRMYAAAIRALSPTLDRDALVEKGAEVLAESSVDPRPNNATKVYDWLSVADIRRAARAVITALIGEQKDED